MQTFKQHWTKILSIFFFIVLFGAYMQIFAVFSPGQTLDPNCAPGAVGCIVESIPSITGNNGKYLTTDGVNMMWNSTPAGVTASSSDIFTNKDLTSVTNTFPTLNQNTTGTSAGLSAAYIDWNALSGGSSILNKPTISGSNTGDETNSTIKTKLGAATNLVDGYLTTTDWNTFNNKVSMTWPAGGAGIPNYSGSSSWGTSYTTTGSGSVVALATTPTFTTNITTPLVLGGTSTTQDLSFQTTSGVGATGADMHFLVGNAGGTEAMTILNNGNVGIGQINPSYKLQVDGASYLNGSVYAGALVRASASGTYSTLEGLSNSNTDWHGSRIGFVRARGVTGARTTVISGDNIGWFDYSGYDGTTDTRAAQFSVYVDGAVSTGIVPGRFVISTANSSGVNTNRLTVYSNDNVVMATNGGSVGIGQSSPTAALHLKAGTATANTAPLKLTAGTNLTAAEAGAVEWDGTNLFITQTTGPTRKTIAYTSDIPSVTGFVPYTGANANVNLGTYSLTTPNIIGGSSTTQDLSFQTTSGVGATGADMHFLVGNAGGTEAMTILNNGYVGVGNTSPTYKLEVSGTSATDGIRANSLDFNQVVAPSQPTMALINSAGNVNAGTHYYHVTYTTALGETSAAVNYTPITTDVANGQVTVTIPVSTDPRVTGRKLYRTKAGGSWWQTYNLATIADNSSTTYVDNIADASMTGVAGMSSYKPNTTSPQISINGTKSLLIDANATFLGISAGNSTLNAGNQVFVGAYAGQNVSVGSGLTFVGSRAGNANTSGDSNSFIGSYAGSGNTTGNSNNYLGTYAGSNNQTGGNNTAIGGAALQGVATNSHSNNTTVGAYSMFSNTTGGANSALGRDALYANTTGSNNVAIGYLAGRYHSDGTTALTDAENSIYLGYGTRGLNNSDTNSIVVGYNAIGQGANTAVWGNTSITDHFFSGDVGISTSAAPSYKLQVGNNTVAGIVSRFENSTGTCDINPTTSSLSCSSDINLKKNIVTLDDMEFVLQTIPDISEKTTLEKINLLTPVVYNWNSESDEDGKHTGFIAQEMEQIFPNIVSTDENTGLKSVAYANMTPYIVKAIQEMNLKIEDINNIEKKNSWRDNLIAWLSNSANGIGSLFSKEIHTEKVCVKKSNGTEKCFNGDEIEAFLGENSPTVEAPIENEPPVVVDDTDFSNTEENSVVGPETTTPVVEEQNPEENNIENNSTDNQTVDNLNNTIE